MFRRGLLLLVAAAAVTGLLAGLARLGVLVAWGPRFAFEHGPLLVVGVFGTVIALERAVALAQVWGYAAPLAGVVAAMAVLGGFPWAGWAGVLCSVALVAVNAAIIGRQSAPFTWLMLLGSLVLVLGNISWSLGSPIHDVVVAWMAFFVLTIAAERLELSRLAPTPSWAKWALVMCAGALVVCGILPIFGFDSLRVAGALVAAIGLWQLRFDLARQTLRRPGLPRFSALGVLLGAAWLVFSGALLAANGLPPAGPLYDAILHGVFVGYVLSMVLAHAPIILPAVARVEIPFHPTLWIAPGLLHVGLIVRIGGDLSSRADLRQLGATLNTLALAAFALAVLVSRRSRRQSKTLQSQETLGNS